MYDDIIFDMYAFWHGFLEDLKTGPMQKRHATMGLVNNQYTNEDIDLSICRFL